MFTIGDFARHGRVSVRMLRHYDATGLLRPARVDPASGYRFYEAVQLARLNRIIALKNLGFTLDQVRAMLDEHVSSCAGCCGCVKPSCNRRSLPIRPGWRRSRRGSGSSSWRAPCQSTTSRSSGSRQSASRNSPQPPRALSPRPLIRSSSRYTASWANGSAGQD